MDGDWTDEEEALTDNDGLMDSSARREHSLGSGFTSSDVHEHEPNERGTWGRPYGAPRTQDMRPDRRGESLARALDELHADRKGESDGDV